MKEFCKMTRSKNDSVSYSATWCCSPNQRRIQENGLSPKINSSNGRKSIWTLLANSFHLNVSWMHFIQWFELRSFSQQQRFQEHSVLFPNQRFSTDIQVCCQECRRVLQMDQGSLSTHFEWFDLTVTKGIQSVIDEANKKARGKWCTYL